MVCKRFCVICAVIIPFKFLRLQWSDHRFKHQSLFDLRGHSLLQNYRICHCRESEQNTDQPRRTEPHPVEPHSEHLIKQSPPIKPSNDLSTDFANLIDKIRPPMIQIYSSSSNSLNNVNFLGSGFIYDESGSFNFIVCCVLRRFIYNTLYIQPGEYVQYNITLHADYITCMHDI